MPEESLKEERENLLKQFQKISEERLQLLGAIKYLNQKIEESDAKIRKKKSK
tara:strand:- start:271 stop:426 length:156 start_codon:yes stop_codon:yes gene_type:complete